MSQKHCIVCSVLGALKEKTDDDVKMLPRIARMMINQNLLCDDHLINARLSNRPDHPGCYDV